MGAECELRSSMLNATRQSLSMIVLLFTFFVSTIQSRSKEHTQVKVVNDKSVEEEIQQQYQNFPYPPRPPHTSPAAIPMIRTGDFSVINQYIYGGRRNFSDASIPF